MSASNPGNGRCRGTPAPRQSLVDVTLSCEGQSLKAHKLVLSACSPYFKTLFQDHSEAHPIVILKDVKFAELRSIIQFMYKGEVEVDQSEIESLIGTAEGLMIRGLALGMASALYLSLVLSGVGVCLAAPDFYSAWCPCRRSNQCPVPYGSFFDDIALFGEVPPCKKFDYVRCCSSSNIPEGFDLARRPEYLPRAVAPAENRQQGRLLAVAADTEIDLQSIEKRQDVIDFKAAQEKLKRDIANGIDNPNPPCGCYTAGTCPGRYSTKSTGRDIGCLAGFETCCFLDDPWPNYQVTNLTINAPCSIEEACSRFFGRSPFDIASFGPLEPCYLGAHHQAHDPAAHDHSEDNYDAASYDYLPHHNTTSHNHLPHHNTTSHNHLPHYDPSSYDHPEPEPAPSGGSSNNIIDIITNGAYLPPSYDFGNAAERAEPDDIQFALPF
ncbi:Longitudinals lacking protein-like [Amphibalanus amphitrite]|uniref:Longitudinals lacking protein-like n=1 Tax=Amphibalanus amphitrite TaxID=1232801 RepID=A0A6A4V4K6_AMPAM|nr:Longitudinals lacking protein-like [Amphibalanus amphitrite]